MNLVTRLLHPSAKLPERGHDIDVGLDVFTPLDGVLRPGPNKVALGISIDVPVGYSASIYPRSGMASGKASLNFKASHDYIKSVDSWINTIGDIQPEGVSILAQMPPIDPGYTGEVHAIVINLSNLYIFYPQHTRFGQLVVHPIVYARPVAQIDTSRGDNAFNSTGYGGTINGTGN